MALDGTATQSSVYTESDYNGSPFDARYAIDSICYFSAWTNNTPPVWWQVDLHKAYEINKVSITADYDGTSNLALIFLLLKLCFRKYCFDTQGRHFTSTTEPANLNDPLNLNGYPKPE